MNIDQHRFSRLQTYSLGVLCALLSLDVHGCAHIPTFPFPGVPIIKTAQDFDAVRNHPIQFQNHPVHLAERIIRAETTPRGVTFLAEWLPFPEEIYAGTEARSTRVPYRPFFMHFLGVDFHQRIPGCQDDLAVS